MRLHVGDYATVWWGSFCFYELCDFGHILIPVEDISNAATWQRTLNTVTVFSLHRPCPDPPTLSCTQILAVVITFSPLYSVPAGQRLGGVNVVRGDGKLTGNRKAGLS